MIHVLQADKHLMPVRPFLKWDFSKFAKETINSTFRH